MKSEAIKDDAAQNMESDAFVGSNGAGTVLSIAALESHNYDFGTCAEESWSGSLMLS